MRILLLYTGYPRLSHSYQHDEAVELSKRHQIMIISWDWPVYTPNIEGLPCLYKHPMEALNEIKLFKPDIIHCHYYNNISLCSNLSSKILNVPFTMRTHSFDILSGNIQTYTRFANSENCKGIICFPSFDEILKKAGVNPQKINVSYPSVQIERFWLDLPNGNDIMSGGALLPKKDIEGFIRLARKIKDHFPDRNVTYYSVQENPAYYESLVKLNETLGSPVQFKTVQPNEMPLEYKKHSYLIYGACPKLRTVGWPLMIAEAQASGVGILMYNLRPDNQDYVSDNGWVYTSDEEVLSIISQPFDEKKRENAIELSKRYSISENIHQLENIWLNK